ncbi:peptidyl-prolyl cis-trans isomerase FKBP4-like [Sycon ciliatum]|uniref:peptidyl-prolyl cis-trans isomerase FKBP4-like n=1 Tax=Sycon ciliatum TaxID=27933 RepID=UPI0020A8E4A9
MDDPRGQDITLKDDGEELAFKRIVKEGPADDKPHRNDDVYVHYVGRLPSGEVCDSTRERGTPFKFQLGGGKVLRGFDVGVATMNVGEQAVMTLTPRYAFGAKGTAKVPANTTVEFDIELLSYTGQDVTKALDGGVLKNMLRAGQGFLTPHNKANVTLKLKCWHGERLIEDERYEFELSKSGGGTSNPRLLTKGALLGLGIMREREVCRLIVEPEYAYGDDGCPELDIPAGATLVYELHLVKLQNKKKVFEMGYEERMEEAAKVKAEGTEYFKTTEYAAALKCYKRGAELTGEEKIFKAEREQKEMGQLRLLCLLNCAATQLKLKMWASARESCSQALELDGDNVKALYRRAEAYLGLNCPEDSIQDLQRVLKLEPDNKPARQRMRQAEDKQKVLRDKEKSLYSNIFSRMAQEPQAQAPAQPNLFEEAQARLDAEKAAQLAKVEQAAAAAAASAVKAEAAE